KKAGVRVKLDDRDASPGWKFNEWEMKGVPLRLEIGPKDIEKQQCVLVRRDTHEKLFEPLEGIEARVNGLLAQIQKDMLEAARKHRDEHTTHAENWDDFKTAIENKNFVFAPWCGETECELAIKQETGATTRNIPFEGHDADGCTCVHCGKKAKTKIYFAKSY
ncbi:MAG: proline--tRNA ligase, partial [Clostridia bacterium]|nr:proline--tRNA ligase [Clostridia bacterium]